MISPGLGSKNFWGPERCTLPNFCGRSAERAAGGTWGCILRLRMTVGGVAGGTACVSRTIDDLQ
eukprot:scaffold103924_cov69-Phaeocystis_antarctica.AAC.1